METFDSAASGIEPLASPISAFLKELRAMGYAPRRLGLRRSVLMAFVQWARTKHLVVTETSEVHFSAFVKRHRRSWDTRKRELATIRRFMAYLHRQGLLPPPAKSSSPVEVLADRYVAYLRTERGLAENSIEVYAPCARAFLEHRVATYGQLALHTLDAEVVRIFLLGHVAERAS